jgi:hypothetical protein
MIETAPRTKGDLTRKRCLDGVKGLLAAVSRKLVLLEQDKISKTLVIEIISANGVLSAVESASRCAAPQSIVNDPEEVLGRIFDQLDALALPDVHKTIRIEIVSVKGTLSAVDTESTRHRWDI